MRLSGAIFVATLLLLVEANPQGINFGGSSNKETKKEEEIANRNYGQQSSPQVQQHQSQQQCCCIPQQQQCLQNQPLTQGDDLVGEGLINERIVNRPGAGQQTLSCARGQRICCYDDQPQDPDYDFSVFQRHPSCSQPFTSSSTASHTSGRWVQGCSETSVYGNQQCGSRNYRGPVRGLSEGESSPGEFPWTCLILNQNNDFLGTCALVPQSFNNDLGRGTRKILTAAHNLKKIGPNDRVKVRVGEYDASGFNPPEARSHIEYTVSKIVRHPQFDAKRLSDDIAVMITSRVIDLQHPYVSPACFPSCQQQFDYVFSNGTGARCWTAGWGKDEFSGSFQFIQHKVDVPLVPASQCNAALKQALNQKKPGVGDRFQLTQGEVCAGTENGKDACTGDGGSPLVCQAQSGRWTVVGLVAWGIGCGSHVPGVYTNVHHYKQWINSID